MRLAKRYLLEAVLLVLCGGVVWALGPYLDIFSGDTYLSDAAWEDLAVETKGRFGQRLFVGAQIGAGVTVVWILCDLAKRRRPKTGGHGRKGAPNGQEGDACVAPTSHGAPATSHSSKTTPRGVTTNAERVD